MLAADVEGIDVAAAEVLAADVGGTDVAAVDGTVVDGTEVGVVAMLLELPDSAGLVADSLGGGVDTGMVVSSVADGGAV